jgi:hypothetical protein
MIFEGFLAHLAGDFLIQSEWMASKKTKHWWPAIVHGLTYTVPFLFLTQSPVALAVIDGTHIVIDRYRLARYVVWLKNWLAPRGWNPPWAKCTATGYPPEKEPGFAIGLLIVTDNTMHLVINSVALTCLV